MMYISGLHWKYISHATNCDSFRFPSARIMTVEGTFTVWCASPSCLFRSMCDDRPISVQRISGISVWQSCPFLVVLFVCLFGGVGFCCVTNLEEMTLTRLSSGCIRQPLTCLQKEESSLKLNVGYINGRNRKLLAFYTTLPPRLRESVPVFLSWPLAIFLRTVH